MLVVLSENNCLNTLNRLGVFPDYFYTDFEAFKSETFLYDHANVVILFAGSSRFTKRIIMDQIILLNKRAEDEADTGIDNLYVVTDVTLGSLRFYYSYHYDLRHIFRTENFKQKDEVDFWGMLRTPPKQSKVVLSAYDKGDSSEARTRFEHRKVTSEDEYLDLIITPDVTSIKRQKELK